MEAMRIVIQSVAEAKNGKALVDGLKIEDLITSEPLTVGILEKGTVGGQTTLMFLQKDPNTGKTHMAQCTAAHFEMLIGAVRGAVERFGK